MTTVPRPAEADVPRPPGMAEPFKWTTQATGLTLWCEPVGELAQHGWTTTSLAMKAGNRDTEPWVRIAAAAGVTSDRVVRLRQVHGAGVHRIGRGVNGALPEADAAVACDPAFALTVQVADCVPLLLLDPHSGAAAAVHAGWRGLAVGVLGAAVRQLESAFDAEPAAVIAAVGPAIGPCCYAVGPELPDAFRRAGWLSEHIDRWFSQAGDGVRLDLWRATRDQLEQAGVGPAHVHLSGLCTACHPQWFASYRRDGEGAGRQVAFIRPAAVTSAEA